MFSDDQTGRSFAVALAELARRDVRVRLLHDWLGCLGEGAARILRQVAAAGAEVRAFNPPRLDRPLGWLTRDHRKAIAIDGRVAFVSGLCVSDRWVGDARRGSEEWRDTGVELRGPSRGIGALGYTIQRPTEDRHLMTREELEAKMAVLLGGRSAEEVVFGQISTGAADDLSRATEIARSMVTRDGMLTELGPLAYETEPNGYLPGLAQPPRRLYSEQTAHEIDVALRGLVEAAHGRARRILEANRALLEEGAGQLLAKETLADAELQTFLRRVVASPPGAPVVAVVRSAVIA